jgi:hypothetical protein
MLHKSRIPTVDKTAGKRLKEVSRSIDFSQQQRPGIGADRASIEAADDFSSSKPLKVKLFGITICFHRQPFSFGVIGFEQANYTKEEGFLFRPYEKCGLTRIFRAP